MNIPSILSVIGHHAKAHKRIAIGSCALLILALSGTVFAITGSEKPSSRSIEPEAVELRTVSPTRARDASTVLILGTVLSHETANIYPRREGIVEDVLVDIGDPVTKGQTVAVLLPKGVEGQSAAKIAEKAARKQQAKTDLDSAIHVAEETVISAKQKIQEKETELMIAHRKQEELLQKFAEQEDDIVQLREQALITSRNARQAVESIVMGSNSRVSDVIREQDMLEDIGRLNPNSIERVYLISALNTVYSLENDYLAAEDYKQFLIIDSLIEETISMLHQATSLLQSTATSPNDPKGSKSFSYAELSAHINTVSAKTDSVLRAEDKLEDAMNTFALMKASEPELYNAYARGEINQKSNTIHMLESQIESAHNTLALTEANQQQMVANRRTQVDIANALLQSEYAQSGHREIKSPFSGTVSKRFIEVGKIVMPSMPAFELTDVPTSLAKKAKAEIQFGLPEHLLGAIETGDTITFFLQTDETVQHEAEVTRKSPQLDLQTRTVTVQAKIPDDLSLPHQASVRIRLDDESTPVYRIPSAAVKREDEKNIVWIVDPVSEEPTVLPVSVVAEDGEFAEVTGDLSEETEIILNPPDLFLTPAR